MDRTADAIPFVEALLNLAAHLLDNTAVVTTNPGACVCEREINVLPVSRVEADDIDLDENVVVAKAGPGNFLNGGFALADEDDGVCRHVDDECWDLDLRTRV